jgi:hypothetical protein|tara:strand:- start:631 stop:1092 length:462 start_codon:yes stop_codon:yes gene_type:complete
MTEDLEDQEAIVVEQTIKAGVFRARRLTLTETWVREGRIAPELSEAARQFADDFDRAQLRPDFQTMSLERVSSNNSREGMLISVVSARRRVSGVMKSIGDEAANVLWDVVGCDMSLRDHAQRQRWNGKPLNTHEVKGRLIAALGMLSNYYRGA